MKKFKKVCIGCDKKMKNPTKEHFWPKWLIKHTKMEKHKIVWINGISIHPYAATIPLCGSCNSELGSKLEKPMMQLLADIENGKGISDGDAEVFIRWAWKMEGFSWRLAQPDDEYSSVYSIKERVLKNIDQIRPRLVLAIALIENPYDGKEFLPMGLCNVNNVNAIIMSGVIASVAFIVLTDDQIQHLPLQFSYYRLNPIRDGLVNARLHYPKVGFNTFAEAKSLTRQAASFISLNFDQDHKNDIVLLKSQELSEKI